MNSEGSSYIRHQSPGGERMAGCTIKLWRQPSADLKTKIVFTGYTGAEIEESQQREIEFYADVALDGVKEFAAERNIDLAHYIVELSQFLIHPLDTKVSDFKQAGRNAFAAAWAAMHNQNL